MPVIEMKVDGMTCDHCVQTVTKAIRSKDTAARVAVDLASGLVSAETMLDRAGAVRAIETAGYKVLPCSRP